MYSIPHILLYSKSCSCNSPPPESSTSSLLDHSHQQGDILFLPNTKHPPMSCAPFQFSLNSHSISLLPLGENSLSYLKHSIYSFSPDHTIIRFHPLCSIEWPQFSVSSYLTYIAFATVHQSRFLKSFFTWLWGHAIVPVFFLFSWLLSLIFHCFFHRKLVSSRAQSFDVFFFYLLSLPG